MLFSSRNIASVQHGARMFATLLSVHYTGGRFEVIDRGDGMILRTGRSLVVALGLHFILM